MNGCFHTDISTAVLHPQTRVWWLPLASHSRWRYCGLERRERRWLLSLKRSKKKLWWEKSESWLALPDLSDSTYGLMYVSTSSFVLVTFLHILLKNCNSALKDHCYSSTGINKKKKKKGIANKSTRSSNINRRTEGRFSWQSSNRHHLVSVFRRKKHFTGILIYTEWS